uniref:STAS domain-containing protein n=1 Tax=Arion vulgaris TaxID=1028688 RepID=A0A0B7A0U8_9EUPU
MFVPVENGLIGSSRRRSRAEDDLEGGDDVNRKVPIREHVKKCCSETFSPKNLVKKFPIVKWLPQYRFGTFQADLIAGLTVGLTVIPQGLAYAQVANLPPQYGLYSAFMGCFVYCFLGTAKDITLGPTAIMSLMTATFGTEISPSLPSGAKDPTIAILLTLISGVIELGMGILKLGILVNFISFPVISAFTSAAAITIALGQVKNILGLKNISNDFLQMVYDTCSKIPETRVWDLTMGLVSLVIVILLRYLRTVKWKDNPDSPPSIFTIIYRKVLWLIGTGGNAIVVIGAAGVVAGLEAHGMKGLISVTGKIQAGMPPFKPPSFELRDGNVTLSSGDIFAKMGAGIGIVPLLALVENMAIGKAFARTNNYKIDPTQELVAIGVANIISSFVSSYPVTGSFSRTAVNSQSGVRTPFGGIWTGGLVILALCVLTPWFYYIPKSALAAVIIAAVIQMVEYHILVVLWKANKWDLFTFIVTFVCSLVVGIEYGILIGIGLSLLLVLYPIARPKIRYTEKSGILIVTPVQGLNFPGAEYLEMKALDKALARSKPFNIILNMEHMSDMDYTAVLSVKSLHVDCGKHDIKLIVANGIPRVTRFLRAGNIKDLIICKTLKDALKTFRMQDGGPAIITDEEEEEKSFISRL